MSETSLTPSARRRLVALTLVAGAALGVLATAGLTTAVPVAADVSGRTAVTDRSELRAELASAAATVERGRDAVAAASAAVAEAKASGFDLGTITIDTTGLANVLGALSSDEAVGPTRAVLTANTLVETEIATANVAELRGRLDAAIAQKQAEEAAAVEAAAQAAALATANTPDGARSVAATIAASEYGWGADQFSCLNSLWNKESGWDYQAYNPSGATGIPQALPGDKMSSAGADWQSNATTQIRWGLGYIASVYGTPCSAWGHSQSMNWY
ncbi:phospholipase [Microbacterium sp. A196]|uniref:aggregation-promoting factor C-terminal-like domain-containing protein n=1 Tax=unclassified Microbacterium TaxID=2609290 RepID=UPI003FD5B76B